MIREFRLCDPSYERRRNQLLTFDRIPSSELLTYLLSKLKELSVGQFREVLLAGGLKRGRH